MSRLAVHFSSVTHEWRTPVDFFRALHATHTFTVDGAAHATNAQLPRWWGPSGEVEDYFATTPAHWRQQCVWLNPPYGRDQALFVWKAIRMVQDDATVRCVTLLPSRTDTKLFHEGLWDADRQRPHPWVQSLTFVRGRLRFEGAKAPAPFPSLVAILGQVR